MMGIYAPTKGKLIYDGQEMHLNKRNDRFKFAKKAQIVFQDPYASLDSRMTVGSIIEEGMIIHNMYDAQKRKERVEKLLDRVGLNRNMPAVFLMSFLAARGSVSVSQELLPLSRSLSCVTSLSLLWTCQFRPRLLTFSIVFRRK